MKRVGLFLVISLLFIIKSCPGFAGVGNGVLITEIMTASATSASSEFVELYNQSNLSVDVTDWKVQYLSATGSTVSTKATLSGAIKPSGFMLIATSVFQTEQSIVADQDLSTGLAGTAGRVIIVDSTDNVMDAVSYGGTALGSEGQPANAPSAGESLKRKTDSDAHFIDDNENSTDLEVSSHPFAQGGGVEEVPDISTDVCPATPEIDLILPVGYEIDENGNCVIISPPQLGTKELDITELMPNADGSDYGTEYVEIYNPNSEPIGFDGYVLYIGSSYEKHYSFPTNLEIEPDQYIAFYNSDISFTLVNTTSKAKLVAPAGNTVSETESYQDPLDGMSWSHFNDGWKYTEKATPDAENEYLMSNNSEESGLKSVAPCPDGKYRNPATNRCKNIETASSSLAPCASDQIRNPETNRCKKASSTTSSLVPCSTGQERNPETNRCRKITSGSASLTPCQPGYERNPETNRCRKATATKNTAFAEPGAINPINLDSRIVALLLFMAGGYAVYEYRTDISNLIDRIRSKRGNPRPPG